MHVLYVRGMVPQNDRSVKPRESAIGLLRTSGGGRISLPIGPRMLWHQAAPRAQTCAPRRRGRRGPEAAASGAVSVGGAGSGCAARRGCRLATSRRGGARSHRVSSRVLGDGRTVPGTVRRCPGPRPIPDVPLTNKCTPRRGLSRGCRKGDIRHRQCWHRIGQAVSAAATPNHYAEVWCGGRASET